MEKVPLCGLKHLKIFTKSGHFPDKISGKSI